MQAHTRGAWHSGEDAREPSHVRNVRDPRAVCVPKRRLQAPRDALEDERSLGAVRIRELRQKVSPQPVIRRHALRLRNSNRCLGGRGCGQILRRYGPGQGKEGKSFQSARQVAAGLLALAACSGSCPTRWLAGWGTSGAPTRHATSPWVEGCVVRGAGQQVPLCGTLRVLAERILARHGDPFYQCHSAGRKRARRGRHRFPSRVAEGLAAAMPAASVPTRYAGRTRAYASGTPTQRVRALRWHR